VKKGHVRLRESGKWCVYYDGPKQNGKRNTITKGGFNSKNEAEEYLQDQLYALRKGIAVDYNNVTLGKYLEEWLENRKSDIAPNTYFGYKTNIEKHIIPEIGNVKLQELKVLHIDRLYRVKRNPNKEVTDKSLSNTSIRYIHRVLRKALQDAYVKELIVKNVADLATVPKEIEHEPKILNENEVKKLIQSSKGSDFYLPVLLAVGLGLRRGEVLGLSWSDIDFNRNTITIKQAVSIDYDGKIFLKPPKTKTSRRTLAAHPEQIRALKDYKKNHKSKVIPLYQGKDLIFCTEQGTPLCPRRFSKEFSCFIAETGLDIITFHELRHTFATILAKHNRATEDISSLLGHTSVAMTKKYMHNAPEVVKTYPEELSKCFF
jgi:integrase